MPWLFVSKLFVSKLLLLRRPHDASRNGERDAHAGARPCPVCGSRVCSWCDRLRAAVCSNAGDRETSVNRARIVGVCYPSQCAAGADAATVAAVNKMVAAYDCAASGTDTAPTLNADNNHLHRAVSEGGDIKFYRFKREATSAR